MTTTLNGWKFHPGTITGTPGALELLADQGVRAQTLLKRHLAGDWGEMCAEDKAVNDRALDWGGRLVSCYKMPDGYRKIWVITEADRSVTTILLPEDY